MIIISLFIRDLVLRVNVSQRHSAGGQIRINIKFLKQEPALQNVLVGPSPSLDDFKLA